MRPRGLNVHIYPADFVANSRVFKITRALADGGFFSHILMVGVQPGHLPDDQPMDAERTIHRLRRPLPEKTRGTLAKSWGTLVWSLHVWRFLRGKDIACINAHSLPVLPLCVALKWRHRAILIYDTHELETETSVVRGIRKPLAKLVERAFIHFADATFCVSERITDWYRDRYGLKVTGVVRNIPDPGPVPAQLDTGRLRREAGIAADSLVFLYLGALAPHRGIERTLKLFAALPASHHLVFMGAGPLQPLVEQAAAMHGNIHYLPPVPYSDVVHVAAGADVGISVIDPICLSHYYALSNKFFEYLHAGLPVLVGDLIEQRMLVEKHAVGWNMPDEDAAAITMIGALTAAEIATTRERVLATRSLYSWQHERETLLAAYRALMGEAA